MVEVTGWTFPSLGDEVAPVLIRPVADVDAGFVQRSKCILGRADRRSLALTAGPIHQCQQDGPQLDLTWVTKVT